MSLKFREWLKLKNRKQLGISEKDFQLMNQNIPVICRISDELIKEAAGEDCQIQKEFDELPEEQKMDLAREAIKKGLDKLKKKKKEEPIEEQESDKISEEQGQSMLQQAQMEKNINVSS
jgi:hypothetical protein